MAKTPTKAFVLPVPGREADIQLLVQLIGSAGCEPIRAKAQKEIEACINAADVLVMLICAETVNDPQINEIAETAARDGKRVVGVWAPGSKDGAAMPSAIHKYGEAVIACDQKAIKETICGEERDWLTTGGEPRAKPKTPRHKGK